MTLRLARQSDQSTVASAIGTLHITEGPKPYFPGITNPGLRATMIRKVGEIMARFDKSLFTAKQWLKEFDEAMNLVRSAYNKDTDTFHMLLHPTVAELARARQQVIDYEATVMLQYALMGYRTPAPDSEQQ